MIVFKVVSLAEDSRYYSALTTGNGEIEYIFGNWSKPCFDESQFLFIFDSLDNAKALIKTYQYLSYRPLLVLEGEAENVKYTAISKYGMTCNAEEFFKGTLFCEAFKPTKLVE
jgi:hypothetical protein